MDASRNRGSSGVPIPGAAFQCGTHVPRGPSSTTVTVQKSRHPHDKPSPRSTLSPPVSPSSSFGSSAHSHASSASQLPEGRSKQEIERTGTDTGYDVKFLKNVAASLHVPKSSSSEELYTVETLKQKAAEAQSMAKSSSTTPLSYDVNFLKHKAAEAQSLPKSATSAPKSYDVNFLKSKAAEAQIIHKSASVAPHPYDVNFLKQVATEAHAFPKSTTTVPSSYDLNFLKQVAAEAQNLPKSVSASGATGKARDGTAAAGPRGAQFLRSTSRDDMFGEVERSRGWTTIHELEEEGEEEEDWEEESLSKHSYADDGQPWEDEGSDANPSEHTGSRSRAYATSGHSWEYEDDDLELSDEEESFGQGKPHAARGGHHKHPSNPEAWAGDSDTRGRLQRNMSRDDMSLPLPKPTWQVEGVPRGPQRGSPHAKKLGRMMSKDDMCLPQQKSRFQTGGPGAGASGMPAKRQPLKMNRTASKCDLSIVAPKPSWPVQQHPPRNHHPPVHPSPARPSSQKPSHSGPLSAGVPHKRLGRQFSKDDMELLSRKAQGTPRTRGPHPSPGTHGGAVVKTQSKAVKKGGYAQEVRIAGGPGAPLPRDASRAGAPTPKGPVSGGISRGAMPAGNLKGQGPMIPRDGSRDAPSRVMPREKSAAAHRGVPPKGGSGLGRQLSRDDMFVDVLHQQRLHEKQAQALGGPPPGARGPRGPNGAPPMPASSSMAPPGNPGSGVGVGFLPSASVGGKKLERHLSTDSLAEDWALQEFHRRRLREKGLALEQEAGKGGKKAASGVRRVESKAVKLKVVGGKGK